jgi:hypothetical protein
MKCLRRNSFIFLILSILLCGCQSSQDFKMTSLQKKELNVIETNSDRIIQECYFMNAEKENNWRHQYILSILNDKNEVIPVYYPLNQEKSACLDQLKKVEKILKKESRVRLCTRDRLEKILDGSEPEVHNFGNLGKHESPYHALTFDTICNSK